MTRLAFAAALFALGAAVEHYRAGGTRHARRQTVMVARMACHGDCPVRSARTDGAQRLGTSRLLLPVNFCGAVA